MTNLIDTRPTGPAAPLPPPRTTPRTPRRTPVAVRVLWKVFAGVLVAAALVWGPYQVVTVLSHDERVETESFAAADITRVEVTGSSGSIDIEASERETIEVRAEISDGLRATGESREVVGGVLQLDSTCPNFGSDFCWVDYELRVPRGLELVIDSENGPVSISGSTAPLTLDADNGSIRLTDVAGPLQVSTDNGSVEATQLRSATVTADSDNGRVQLEFVAAPMTVVATSNNGRVEVVVPADGTAYRVDARTDSGSENIDVPTDPRSSRTITLGTDNGSVTARTG
jgi:Putative adhesin